MTDPRVPSEHTMSGHPPFCKNIALVCVCIKINKSQNLRNILINIYFSFLFLFFDEKTFIFLADYVMKGTNNYKVSTLGVEQSEIVNLIKLLDSFFFFFFLKGEYLIVMLKKYLII